MRYRIKNWRTFQHYHDRNPPWIKLHFSILSSPDWVMLDDASRVIAIAVMLIASRQEGEIDGSRSGLEYLKRVAYLNKTPNLKPLIDCGFLECVADASGCKQNGANVRPETETETETEERQRREEKQVGNISDDCPQEASNVVGIQTLPPCPQQAIVDLYHEVLPELPRVAVLTDARQQHVKARWRECWSDKDFVTQAEGLQTFRKFFEHVRGSKWLMGMVAPATGRSQFIADYDFLFKPGSFAKVIEGRYHDGRRTN